MDNKIDYSKADEGDSSADLAELIGDYSRAETTSRLQHAVYEFENLKSMAQLEKEWRELASACGTYSQCTTYEYCTVAAETVFSAGGTVAVAVVYDAGHIAALWPLAIRKKAFFSIAQALSCGSGEEYGGPIIGGAAAADLVAKALQALCEVDADILEIPWVEDGSASQAAIEAVAQPWLVRRLPRKLTGHPAYGGNPGFSINLSQYPQWDDYRRAIPGKHRRDHQRRMKQLRQSGTYEFGWCKTWAECDDVIDWIFTHKRRWAAARGITTHYLQNDGLKSFFSKLAHKIDLEKFPLIAFIKIDGVPVAGAICLQGSHCLEYFIATYDKEYARYSVGIALLLSLAEIAHARGLVFDMRYSHEPYKEFWSNQQPYFRVHRLYLTRSNLKVGLIVLAYAASRAAHLIRRKLHGFTRRFGTRKPSATLLRS